MKNLIRILNMFLYTSTGRFIIQLIALLIATFFTLLWVNR